MQVSSMLTVLQLVGSTGYVCVSDVTSVLDFSLSLVWSNCIANLVQGTFGAVCCAKHLESGMAVAAKSSSSTCARECL